jgi:threonine/homoserine/homoserine lactone efflux protein
MFGIADYPAFVLAVIVFLAIPGPGNLALLTSTAKGGLRGGLAATLGVIAGDQLLMWAAVAGVAAVLATQPEFFQAMQWLGAAYLSYIGYKMWTTQEGDAPVINITAGHYFRQSLWITLLNPKAIMFYMAFFPLFIDPQAHAGFFTFGVMALTVAALTFIYGLLICVLAKQLSTRLQRRPWVGRGLQKLGAGLLVAFGLKLVLGK